MYLTKEDAEKILKVINDFPEASNYKLGLENSSGIGSIITLTMSMNLRNYNAQVTVTIAGEEKW